MLYLKASPTIQSIKKSLGIEPAKYTMEEKAEMSLKHMKEKYGEEFVCTEWSGEGIYGRNCSKFILYPKKTPENKVIVEWYYDYDKKDYKVYDNYMGILIKDKYTDYITKLIRTKYPLAYVQVSIYPERCYPDEFTLETPINKISTIGDFPMFLPEVTIVIPYKEIENDNFMKYFKTISDLFLNNKLEASLFMYICKDDKFDEYVSKDGKIYPDEYYDDDIAGKYFIKTDGIPRINYGHVIGVHRQDGSDIMTSNIDEYLDKK